MPAISQNQQMVAGMADAIQKGKIKPKLGTPSAEMAQSMKPNDVQEIASTPRKSLPVRTVKTGTMTKKKF